MKMFMDIGHYDIGLDKSDTIEQPCNNPKTQGFTYLTTLQYTITQQSQGRRLSLKYVQTASYIQGSTDLQRCKGERSLTDWWFNIPLQPKRILRQTHQDGIRRHRLWQWNRAMSLLPSPGGSWHGTPPSGRLGAQNEDTACCFSTQEDCMTVATSRWRHAMP